MRCKSYKRLISDGLDGPLEPAPKARLEAHLASCRDCRAYGKALEKLQTASRASFAAAAIPDPRRMARSLARLKAGLREASVLPVSAPRPRWVWAGAAAALFVAFSGLYLVFFRLDPTVDFVPYAYSDARSGLALSLAEDDALAQAFDSAIRASLDEAVAAVPAEVEPLVVDTGRYLDSLSDEEVLLLEAAIQESKAL